MSKKVERNLNQGQTNFKEGEVYNEDLIIHRMLFSLNENNAKNISNSTLRYWKHLWKNKKMGAAHKEEICLASGFVKKVSAEWEYTNNK